MKELTSDHYQKKAILRCAAFLPTKGPSLSKNDSIHVLPFQKAARDLFDVGLLSVDDAGVMIPSLARMDDASWNDLGFFYNRVFDMFWDDIEPYLATPKFNEMTDYELFLLIEEKREELESCEEAKKVLVSCEEYLQARREKNDAVLKNAMSLEYWAKKLVGLSGNMKIKQYLSSRCGAAYAATLFNLLQSDCVPYDTADEGLYVLAYIFSYAADGTRAYKCAVCRAKRMIAEGVSQKEQLSAKRMIADVLRIAFGQFSAQEYIRLLKKEHVS